MSSRLADVTTAFERAEAHAALERDAADARFAQQQAAASVAHEEAAARARVLEQHVQDAETARLMVEQAYRSAMRDADARLAAQETRANDRLTEALSAHQATERQLSDARTAIEHAEHRYTAGMATAANELSDLQRQRDSQAAHAASTIAALQSLLEGETAERQRLETQVADAQAANARAAREHASALAAEAARFAEAEQQAAARLVFAMASAEAVEQQLAAVNARLETVQAEAAAERIAATAQAHHRQAEFDAERRQLIEARQVVVQELADARNARARADEQHASEIAAAAVRLAEHDTRAATAIARAAADLDAAHRAARDQIAAVDAAAAQRAAEQQTVFDIATKEAAAQRHGVERVLAGARATLAETERRLTETVADHQRQFDDSAVSLCRCHRDGAPIQVNRALATRLGYDSPEELTRVGFAEQVFESVDELQWIIAQCRNSHPIESIETTWKKKDGSRLLVRVLARSIAADAIELAVEDLTTFRALEERLRHAQRLEAVARYASEVAVTCGAVLGDAQAEGQRWLATIESDTVRYRGELLLSEVTRAAGLVQQLAECGTEQMTAAALVDVNKVLRDLAPVLKRVAGGHVDIALPKASAPLNLDVEAARVERILVNVAAFGRQRMPLGGRLMIEVDAVVLDRQFVAKYPSVRSGPHVLLTVTEKRSESRAAIVAGESFGAAAGARPGVDLGALQGLVSDCGGHLRITAEPSGDMVLKMHLPRRALDRAASDPVAKPSLRARWVERLSGARRAPAS